MDGSYAVTSSNGNVLPVVRDDVDAPTPISQSVFRPEFSSTNPNFFLRFALKDATQTMTVRVPVYLGTLPIPTSDIAMKKKDLVTFWNSIRDRILVNNTPDVTREIPDLNAPADLIFTWMQNHKPALARVREIHCQHLHEIPDLSDFTGLEVLSLSGQFTSVQPDAFKHLTRLQSLTIYDSKLNDLPIGIFDNLSNLHYLRLHHNSLTEIPHGLLDKLNSLWELDLSHNQIRELPANLLANQYGLQRVDLSNNRLTSLPIGFFDGKTSDFYRLQGLPNLQIAMLCNNPLRELPFKLFYKTDLQFLSIDADKKHLLDKIIIAKLEELLNQCPLLCNKGPRLLTVKPDDPPIHQETWNRNVGQHAILHCRPGRDL